MGQPATAVCLGSETRREGVAGLDRVHYVLVLVNSIAVRQGGRLAGSDEG